MDISAQTDNGENDALQCVLCNRNEGKLSKLGKKGCNGLLETSKRKGEALIVEPGQHVHAECRTKYCHPNYTRQMDKEQPDVHPRARRSEDNSFNFKSSCLFCGNSAKLAAAKRGSGVFPVRTLDFQKTIKETCISRNDDWSKVILCRLEYAQDLPAVEARYHQACSSNFRTGYGIPTRHQNNDTIYSKKGRPSSDVTNEAFENIVMYLEEHKTEQISVLDLVDKMHEFCGEDAYSSVYMKKRLQDYFGCEIVMSKMNGKQNVITFKNSADAILHSFHRQSKHEDEKNDVIKAAAKLILQDINSLDLPKDIYPNPVDITTLESNHRYVPPSLLMFLQQIIDSKNSTSKVAAISQSIVQAASPRGAILPLQLGLGVQMHHQFGSKHLVDTLNSLGFCSSYSEVQRYEDSAATKWNFEIETGEGCNRTIQFVADNVDHNVSTLDGHNTFHGMGMIATITPGVKCIRSVPRVYAFTDDLAEIGRVNVKYYSQKTNNFDGLKFQELCVTEDIEDPLCNLEFLVKIARPLKLKTPSWSGFMQTVQTGRHSGKSSILFLPMIDLNPSDMTCIYSTLCFVAEQAKRLSVTPTITFDQPLYWKSVQIVTNENCDSILKQMVLRLGAFHTQMSFLGCIGQLMQNSGLQELIETIYASNSVTHMLSGKAVSRGIRAHFLVQDALNTLLVEKLFPHATKTNQMDVDHVSLADMNNNVSSTVQNELTLIETLKLLFQSVYSRASPIDSIAGNRDLHETLNTYTELINSLNCYRTAKLWIQYMEMVDLLKRFIKAERTGNWNLHLQTMLNMLPYFAAAGHHLYLKSGYIYLQQMSSLKNTHPDVYTMFSNGNHVVRRSDRYWAGLSTDLVIEQALMRSVKSTGGMTRGRGMSEVQRVRWLLSMPACSDINAAMQEFTGQRYESSEQHKEAQESRIVRDTKDVDTLVNFLKDRSPFAAETNLRNIETGCVAEARVNVDNSKAIGEVILKDMENKNVSSYSFKRSLKAVTLGSKNVIEIGEEEIQVDPQLLFQRLLTVSDLSLDNPFEVFKYELCSHPASLFDSSGLMREAQKPTLANAIWELGPCGVDILPTEDMSYVLDGGSLIHRLPWRHGALFGELCDSYVQLVHNHYSNACIVFDGYSNTPSIKDQTHERRAKGIKGTRIVFDENTPFKSKKELFLANIENKQQFINMLSLYLVRSGCTVYHAQDDADVLIVKTAVNKAALSCVISVIGEDTDLLVLLCFYSNPDNNTIYFTSDIKSGLKGRKIWDINKTTEVLGKDVCRSLLFVHAFTGCDTTSRIYGLGKGIALKKVISDPVFRNYAAIFLQETSKETVEETGEAVFIKLFNGLQCQGLNLLRYCKFLHKVQSKKSAVLVQSLPPTSGSAKYHSYRVYLQIQTWLEKSLSPLEWGWTNVSNKCVPIKTMLPAAPERLLNMIRCCCRQSCDTRRCTCKKHGLNCTAACGECRGLSCSNRGEIIDESSYQE